MGQNVSSAVMQRRREPHASLDDFPTPPWAVRALCESLVGEGYDLFSAHVWEPACNRGFMVRALFDHFEAVQATDIHDYGWDGVWRHQDFLLSTARDAAGIDWIVTNPPFRLGADFILKALELAPRIAVLVRTSFDEGQGRYERLFRDHPETYALPFAERVCMWRGVLLDPDVPVWDAQRARLSKPSTATSYQWLVWDTRKVGAPTCKRRIAPCRRRLTRPGDYPPVPAHLRAPEADHAG